MPVSPARIAAFEILIRIESTAAFASELLHSSRFAKLSAADHRLATELVMGVLRWRSVLDERIAAQSRGTSKFDVEVLTALRLGAYQLLFLDRVPRHAAVNESVELVKLAHKRSAAGLVNAVLRKISTAAEGSQFLREQPEPLFDTATHPRWLVERWERTYGPEITGKICAYDQLAPVTALRLRTLDSWKMGELASRSDAAESAKLLEQLRSEGIEFAPGKLLARAAIVAAGDVTRTKAFREHRLVLQDEASQLVAMLAGAGNRILDCCAAPGGKTRILAEQNPNSQVVAMELHAHRAVLLKKLVSLPNVHVVAADARTRPFSAKFDRVLVDAPCTGTGTLARNPEIKWRLQPDDILRLQKYQIELLEAAMRHVTSGGRIIYSTCSLEPEENEAVVEQALAGDASFRLMDCQDALDTLRTGGQLVWNDIRTLLNGPYLRTLPGVHPCDGFFAAILEKI